MTSVLLLYDLWVLKLGNAWTITVATMVYGRVSLDQHLKSIFRSGASKLYLVGKVTFLYQLHFKSNNFITI